MGFKMKGNPMQRNFGIGSSSPLHAGEEKVVIDGKTYPKGYTKEDVKFLKGQREDVVRYEDLDAKGKAIWKSQGKAVPLPSPDGSKKYPNQAIKLPSPDRELPKISNTPKQGTVVTRKNKKSPAPTKQKYTYTIDPDYKFDKKPKKGALGLTQAELAKISASKKNKESLKKFTKKKSPAPTKQKERKNWENYGKGEGADVIKKSGLGPRKTSGYTDLEDKTPGQLMGFDFGSVIKEYATKKRADKKVKKAYDTLKSKKKSPAKAKKPPIGGKPSEATKSLYLSTARHKIKKKRPTYTKIGEPVTDVGIIHHHNKKKKK